MMIFKNYFFIFCLSLSLSSCSFFAKKLNLPASSEEIGIHSPNPGPLYCAEKRQSQIIGNSAENNQVIQKFLDQVQEDHKLSFIEKAVVIHLLQMLARPDLSSPQAKLDFYFQNSGKTYFKSFSSAQDGLSYIRGLETILKDFKSKKSLAELMKIIDRKFQNDLVVDEDFAKFLKENKAWISKSTSSQKLYLRAEETLRKGESLPSQKLFPLYQKNFMIKKAKTEEKSYLYSYYDKNKNEFRCNYDMNQYGQSLFFISDYFIRGNIFGYKSGKNFFISSSTQNFYQKSLEKSLFFQGSSQVRSLAICVGKNLGIVSNNSRDPGQHIYHLIEYELAMAKSHPEMNSMISFSRHLFLTNPLRLIYESQRGSSQQLSELLELNVPLYNSDSLGRLWGWYKASQGHFSFHLDSRSLGAISCPK